MKINRRNLKTLWKQLDDACGALDNATTNIADMDLPIPLKGRAAIIDISNIVAIKNEIEAILEETK